MRRILLLAHNIRSLWNVGSLFRTADCFDVERIFLTGYTACPPRREISKTALGAQEWIAWQHSKDPLDEIHSLQKEGWCVVALEQAEGSQQLRLWKPPERLCLVVGHEVLGVPDAILAASDVVVHIPMFGKKQSLNVSVAAGIALHHARCTP